MLAYYDWQLLLPVCVYIEFLGAFKDAETGPILVMEKMKEYLWQFLEKCRDKFALHEQLDMSVQITQGVAFLHQLKPPVVHCNLNDKNVMLSSEGLAKIGEFGDAKLKQDLYLTTDTKQVGKVHFFMAPEVLHGKNSKYDESIDVFALGVLMLEIGTQRRPTKDRKTDLGRMSHSHPLKPSILCCLRDDPKLRPKASELEIITPTLNRVR